MACAVIDGFYFRSSFDRYKTLALINPEHPVELSNEIETESRHSDCHHGRE